MPLALRFVMTVRTESTFRPDKIASEAMVISRSPALSVSETTPSLRLPLACSCFTFSRASAAVDFLPGPLPELIP